MIASMVLDGNTHEEHKIDKKTCAYGRRQAGKGIGKMYLWLKGNYGESNAIWDKGEENRSSKVGHSHMLQML